MNILPLAAESLGVRSAAFFVETADVKVLIDPGVSLAPVRFGLPPHPREIRAMNERWRLVKDHAALADVLVITHYHFDHFDPTEPLLFNGKTLLIKHPKENINASQRQRARELVKNLRTLPRRVEFCDGGRFEFGGTVVRFSDAVPHGPTTKVGWVVEVSVREGEDCFVHSSDVQGACRPEQARFIAAENPRTLYLDGPLTYLLGQGFTPGDLRASIRSIAAILEQTAVRTLIVDHHLLRDPDWRGSLSGPLALAAKLGRRIVTAAEFLGEEEELLEAHRSRLFAREPDMPEVPIERNRSFQLVRELAK